MHRPILALALATLCAPAFADDTGVHPAMECAPDDQACIDRANREYEAAKRARKGAAVPIRPSPTASEAPAPPIREAPEPPVAVPVEPERAGLATRTFHRDEGLYATVWSVDQQVRVVEAHPVDAVDRAAEGVEAPTLTEEDADQLERSAQTWQDLAEGPLPDEAEAMIRLGPLPVSREDLHDRDVTNTREQPRDRTVERDDLHEGAAQDQRKGDLLQQVRAEGGRFVVTERGRGARIEVSHDEEAVRKTAADKTADGDLRETARDLVDEAARPD